MILPICTYPNPVLRQPCEAVEVIDDELRELVGNMVETMYHANGVGLAAPQVGVNLTLLVMDVSESRDEPLVVINPYLESKSREREACEEGCLSVPGVSVEVERPAEVVVSAQNLAGEEVEFEADGLLARCIQHEMDHLDGVLLFDKAAESEKFRVRDELHALEAEAAERSN